MFDLTIGVRPVPPAIKPSFSNLFASYGYFGTKNQTI
jgi:hypothetical protein